MIRRRRTKRFSRPSRWRGSMSTETASGASTRALPGDDLIGLEHRLQQVLPRELLGYAAHDDAGRQAGHGRAVERDDRHRVAGGELTGHGRRREIAGLALEKMKGLAHQKTRKRRPARTRSAISWRVTRTT